MAQQCWNNTASTSHRRHRLCILYNPDKRHSLWFRYRSNWKSDCYTGTLQDGKRKAPNTFLNVKEGGSEGRKELGRFTWEWLSIRVQIHVCLMWIYSNWIKWNQIESNSNKIETHRIKIESNRIILSQIKSNQTKSNQTESDWQCSNLNHWSEMRVSSFQFEKSR